LWSWKVKLKKPAAKDEMFAFRFAGSSPLS
jgi:hypothetical protein